MGGGRESSERNGKDDFVKRIGTRVANSGKKYRELLPEQVRG